MDSFFVKYLVQLIEDLSVGDFVVIKRNRKGLCIKSKNKLKKSKKVV